MAGFCWRPTAAPKAKFLQDWDTTDQFCFNDRDVLQGAGGISKKAADEKPEKYLIFMLKNVDN